MNNLSRLKQTTLIIGDILTLYAALILTLWLRYGNLFYAELINYHIQPFTIIFGIWIAVSYIAGLYDLKFLKNGLEFEQVFWNALIFNVALTAIFFYLIPYFGITPKTNLVIFFLVFGGINYLWRQIYNFAVGKTGAANRVLIVGSNKTAQEIMEHIQNNPQLGYQVKYWMQEGLKDIEFGHLAQIIMANNINTMVIPAHLKKDSQAAKLIYKTIVLGIEVMELSRLHEIIFHKVPLAELEEVWFLENLVNKHKIYELLSGPLEIVGALLLGIILSPLIILIAILIKFTSPGPVIFRQTRIGKHEKEFTIYKFRTMYVDAEKSGPQWANYHQDKRATWIGKILRRSHLDELPQLINILKGELSFVGPRPERPEFVVKLRKELPYYDLRHLTKPGITGWAQINYRYAASAEDAYQKLQYDIYYIKNNSPLLDFLIILRTIKFLITNHT
ncbi:MAG: exopolysaccharide biosynthesis polyprenyl glycosylphosphotransferase [Candidatus Harrisonbacteria bacterium]|nr:exopolysaccharide biosynthesis polyprenyl glycosylphosphotransferase [Candidatus Harrisonbacteria bacterium]